MFVLAEIKDYIRIPPHSFHKPLKQAITEELNKKLANKVVMNVGLCIALWDITELGDSHIIPGDGCCHTKVNYRYVVFRPFMTEILIGKVKSCNREGVTVTLGFFDDILIPSSSLQHPSRFDEAEQVWVWEYQVEEEKHDLFMDIGELIRFRVTTELFEETSPAGPEVGAETESVEPKVPYSLIASINEPGLGLMSCYKVDIGKIDEDYKDCLAEVENLLKKCEEKIRLKPRHAEIRNVIGELVRKKNIEQGSQRENVTNAEKIEDSGKYHSTCSFKREKFLKSRALKFQDEKRYLCEFCGERFSRCSSVKSHILKIHYTGKNVTLERDYLVEVEEVPHTKSANNINNINNNDNKDSEPYNSSDKFCKKDIVDNYCREPNSGDHSTASPRNPTLLLNSNQIHLKEVEIECNISHVCHGCNKIFRLERSLKKHIRLKHSLEKEMEFRCSKCNKTFTEKGKLNRHISSHGQGAFQCGECNRTFHRGENLRRHIAQLHQKIKSFKCSYCHKPFTLKFNRDAHEKNVHESNAELQCELCGKKCKNKSTFDKHKKIHKGNPFSCTLCSKKFIRKVQYRNHLKAKHKGISPFQKLFDSFADATPGSPS